MPNYWNKKDSSWDVFQSSVVITRSNIARYCIFNYRHCDKISIRCWIHKRNTIPRPNGRAMAFFNMCENIDRIITATQSILFCTAILLGRPPTPPPPHPHPHPHPPPTPHPHPHTHPHTHPPPEITLIQLS